MKTIIYDDTCPMCNFYTRQFVKMGVLPENGRITFSNLDQNLLQEIDLDRARHEIPLLDSHSHQTIYGLDALTFLLAKHFPLLAPLLNHQYFKALLKPLYKFISYNRRVIMPSPKQCIGIDPAPDFNLKARFLLVLLFSFLVFGLQLSLCPAILFLKSADKPFPLVCIWLTSMAASGLLFCYLLINQGIKKSIDQLANALVLVLKTYLRLSGIYLAIWGLTLVTIGLFSPLFLVALAFFIHSFVKHLRLRIAYQFLPSRSFYPLVVWAIVQNLCVAIFGLLFLFKNL